MTTANEKEVRELAQRILAMIDGKPPGLAVVAVVEALAFYFSHRSDSEQKFVEGAIPLINKQLIAMFKTLRSTGARLQ